MDWTRRRAAEVYRSVEVPLVVGRGLDGSLACPRCHVMMSKDHRRKDAEARREIREITARWSAVRALVAWAGLSSQERARITEELELLQFTGHSAAVGVALDALEAIPAVVATHALARAATDIERLALVARDLVEHR